MSLFGKILALFNVLGAVGLFLLGVMDYGKRQQWSHAVMMRELHLRGLPLDDKELDEQGRPMVEQLSPSMIAELYDGLGSNNPPTQVGEVKRVQASFDEKVNALEKDERSRTHLLSRILLPLSDGYLEREEYLAARHYFASPARFEEFERRYKTAFEEAGFRATEDPKAGPVTSFEEAMHVAMRAQGGEASEAFTVRFIALLPAEVAKIKATPFRDAFAKTVADQSKALRDRLDTKFKRALTGPSESPEGKTAMTQKRTIARTLFALAQPTAEEATADDKALAALDRNKAEYARKLADTPAYKTAVRRVYATSGLRVTLAAVADEGAEVRRQASSATEARLRDQLTFVRDHEALVEELRDRYELVKIESDRVKDNEEKIKTHEGLIEKRKTDRNNMAEELAVERAGTKDAADKLAATSDEVLRLRLLVRDAIRETEEAEREIRRLEALIKSREKSGSKSKKK